MHRDQVLCVLTQDPSNKNKNENENENIFPLGVEGVDKIEDFDTDNRITLMGCGMPGKTKGLTLKVMASPTPFLFFILFILMQFYTHSNSRSHSHSHSHSHSQSQSHSLPYSHSFSFSYLCNTLLFHS